MISRRTHRFRQALEQLPQHIQDQANEAFRTRQENPQHPSLQFKRIHQSQPIFSARVGLYYRAIGVRRGEVMVWFWIGSHAEYDKLIARL